MAEATSDFEQPAEPAQDAAGGSADVAAPGNGAAAKSAAARSRPSKAATEKVARAYFDAISRHDIDAAVAAWAPGGREYVRGQVDVTAPEGVREFIGGLLGALPDLRFEVVRTTTEADRCAVQWRLTGTFAGPGSFNGIEPTGSPVVLEGLDVLTVRDGLVQANDAFTDSMTFARAIGMMPPQGSPVEQRMFGAFNAKTRLGRRLAGPGAEKVADGVWVVQGQPARCNVYLLEDGDGVTLFDAGARTMVRQVAAAAAPLGGVRRIVLGHGHTDHRGVAPSFDVPVLCHPDDVQDAEGSGGFRYWGEGLPRVPLPHRPIHRLLHRFFWDGGPVKISDTVEEGDEVAGFRVVHLPGHAPGLIGLWRESDRVALVSDTFYTLDIWGRDIPPHVPLEAYNYDTAQARESIRKLASLDPAAAWAGHAKPVLGDVRGQLERAAVEV
jgi:glyoxylase-like metal-dependent hydrolase (beta-lactamase superfamily II)/ketosteroid isomerase-like protein